MEQEPPNNSTNQSDPLPDETQINPIQTEPPIQENPDNQPKQGEPVETDAQAAPPSEFSETVTEEAATSSASSSTSTSSAKSSDTELMLKALIENQSSTAKTLDVVTQLLGKVVAGGGGGGGGGAPPPPSNPSQGGIGVFRQDYTPTDPNAQEVYATRIRILRIALHKQKFVWCPTCSCLYADGLSGPCPPKHGGATHSTMGTYYQLRHVICGIPNPILGIKANWCRCTKCGGIGDSKDNRSGKCYQGSNHQYNIQANYIFSSYGSQIFDELKTETTRVSKCTKCKLLVVNMVGYGNACYLGGNHTLDPGGYILERYQNEAHT